MEELSGSRWKNSKRKNENGCEVKAGRSDAGGEREIKEERGWGRG